MIFIECFYCFQTFFVSINISSTEGPVKIRTHPCPRYDLHIYPRSMRVLCNLQNICIFSTPCQYFKSQIDLPSHSFRPTPSVIVRLPDTTESASKAESVPTGTCFGHAQASSKPDTRPFCPKYPNLFIKMSPLKLYSMLRALAQSDDTRLFQIIFCCLSGF